MPVLFLNVNRAFDTNQQELCQMLELFNQLKLDLIDCCLFIARNESTKNLQLIELDLNRLFTWLEMLLMLTTIIM